MDELKEAVAVEPGDKDLNHNRIPSDDSRIIRACANLVVFDKDDRKVSLAHHTVKEFLLGLWPNATPTLPTFCFDLSKANRELAGVCLTYFHFNAFETQLTHTVDVPAPNMNELVPGIMREVLSPSMFGKGLLSGWSRIQGLRNNFQQSIVSLGRYGRNIHRRKLNLNPEHRLLQYVIEYWLFHTADLTRNDSDLWDLFQNLVLDKRIPFDFRPWKEVSPDREFPYLPILYWAIEEGNVALLNVLMPKGSMPPRYCNRIVSESVAKASTLSSALSIALKRGHLHIWEILLFQVPELQWSQFSERLHGLSASEKNKVVLLAVEGGYLEVTKCLVLNGVADVEWGTADRWLTLVEIALARGHTDIAHLLQLKAPHSLLHLF